MAVPGRSSTHQRQVDGCLLDTYSNSNSHKLEISDETDASARVKYENSRIEMDFLGHFHLSFRVQRSDSFGCFFNAFQVFLDKSISNSGGIVGLLGSPNGDITDDWMSPNGNFISVPTDENGKLFEQAYNYCTQNWCLKNEQQSFFTYSGINFAELSKCEEPYGTAPDLSSASEELQNLCQGNTACLIDGLAGDIKYAESALEVQPQIGQNKPEREFNKCFVPNLVRINQLTTVRISYEQPKSITDVTAYDVVELDNSHDQNRIGPNGGTTIVQLLDDGSAESTDRVPGDNIFTNQITVTFTQSGQVKNYVFIPIINNVRNYDPAVEEIALVAIQGSRKPAKASQTCAFDPAPSISSSPSLSISPSGTESQSPMPSLSISLSPSISASFSSSVSPSPTFSSSSSTTISPSASSSLPQTPSTSTSATPTTSMTISGCMSATPSLTMSASMTISSTATASTSVTASSSQSSTASASTTASIIPSQSSSVSVSISSSESPSISLSLSATPSSSTSMSSTSSATVSESILPTPSTSTFISISSMPTPSWSSVPDPCLWMSGPPSCFDCPSEPACISSLCMWSPDPPTCFDCPTDPMCIDPTPSECMWTPGPPSCFSCPSEPMCDQCAFGGCDICPSDPAIVVDPFMNPGCPAPPNPGPFGEPHMRTFDGLGYDCQGSGEFVLFRTRRSNVEIQTRFSGDAGNATVITGIAVKVKNMPIVELSIALSDSSSADQISSCPIRTYFNGSKRSLKRNTVLESDVSVNVSSSTIRVSFGNHLITSLVIIKSTSFGCFFQQLQTYMSQAITMSEDIVGLLGTPNGNPFDDWMDQSGNTLQVPRDEHGKLFKPAYDYCTSNWCIRSETESLFTHSETLRFDDLNKCDTPYGTAPDLSSASDELKTICGSDTACLIDGIAGGVEDAENALEAQSKIEQEMSVGGVKFDPSVVRTGETVNIRITVHLIGDNANSVESYDLVRIDTESGDPIGPSGGTTVTKLFDDGSQQRNDSKAGDGIFTTVMAVHSDIVGERFSYALVPIVGGRRSNDPNIYRTILGAVRSYSVKAKVSIPPQVPKSEFSLSVSNFRGVGILVSYTWTQGNQDLDSSTRFLGGSVGFACSPGSPYLKFLTETDNEEQASVQLDDARRDGEWASNTEVQFYAGWYDDSSNGPATLTVTLHNFTSGKDIPNRSLIRAIDPGTGGACVPKQVAKMQNLHLNFAVREL